MKVQHDREADALYIELSSVKPQHGLDVEGVPGLSVDLDDAGRIVGIEILDVSKRLDPSTLAELSFEDLVAGQSGTITLNGVSTRTKSSTRKAS